MKSASSLLTMFFLTANALAQSGSFNLVKTVNEHPQPRPAISLPNQALIATGPAAPNAPKIETPPIEIGGLLSVPIGETIDLWVKPLAARPANLYSVVYSWFMLPARTPAVWPDTTRVITGTGNKAQTFTFNVTAAYVFVTKDGDKITGVEQRIAEKKIEVQVTDGTPAQPGGLSGLAKNSADWVASVTRTTTYADAQIRVDAKKLAASFKTIADQIDANQITADKIVSTTKEKNDSALADHITEWLPWFQKITAVLNQNYKGAAPQQLSAAWKDIAKGLEAAAQ